MRSDNAPNKGEVFKQLPFVWSHRHMTSAKFSSRVKKEYVARRERRGGHLFYSLVDRIYNLNVVIQNCISHMPISFGQNMVCYHFSEGSHSS